MQGSVDQAVQTPDLSPSAEWDQRDLLFLTRLETDCGAGRDVEAHPVRSRALEGEGAVHFEEMEMRADLNRSITRVGDDEIDDGAADVCLDGLGAKKVLTGNHRCLHRPLHGSRPS